MPYKVHMREGAKLETLRDPDTGDTEFPTIAYALDAIERVDMSWRVRRPRKFRSRASEFKKRCTVVLIEN